MATKKVKKINSKIAKTTKKSSVKPVVPEVEEDIEIVDTKGKVKKPVEIDAADILPEVEEKVIEEENPLIALEEEEDAEAGGIDDEDLNPFGDKWEE